jgi:hypothetical protein
MFDAARIEEHPELLDELGQELVKEFMLELLSGVAAVAVIYALAIAHSVPDRSRWRVDPCWEAAGGGQASALTLGRQDTLVPPASVDSSSAVGPAGERRAPVQPRKCHEPETRPG